MRLQDFLENLFRFGLEFFRKYYGPYRAIVVSNKDPLKMGRIQITCPRAKLGKDNGKWFLPMMAGAGAKTGTFWPPQEGDAVWIFFDNGDPNYPACYAGSWYGADQLHDDLIPTGTDGTPDKRGFVTPGGSKLIFDDSGDETITIEHKNGKIVKIKGDKVQIGSKNGSFEPMLKGDVVKQWLITHIHPTIFGPTSPTSTPFPLNGLSEDVEGS